MRTKHRGKVITRLNNIIIIKEREGLSLIKVIIILKDIERCLGGTTLLIMEHDAHRRRRAHRQEELRVLHPVDVVNDVPAVGLLVPGPLQHDPLELDLLHLGRRVQELQAHLPHLLAPVGLLGDHNVPPRAQLGLGRRELVPLRGGFLAGSALEVLDGEGDGTNRLVAPNDGLLVRCDLDARLLTVHRALLKINK